MVSVMLNLTQSSWEEFEGRGHQGQKTTFFDPFGGLRVVYIW